MNERQTANGLGQTNQLSSVHTVESAASVKPEQVIPELLYTVVTAALSQLLKPFFKKYSAGAILGKLNGQLVCLFRFFQLP